MQDIVSILKTIINVKDNNDIIIEENEDNLSQRYLDLDNNDNIIEENDDSLLQKSLDINDDLDINDILDDINYGSSLQNQTSIQSGITNSKNNQSSISIQTSLSKDSFDSTYNNINNLIVDKLIAVIIKKHDNGYTFDQIQELIDKKMLQFSQITNNLISWLAENQDKPKYIWLFGLLYYY